MTEVAATELASTYDCKTPNCTGTARSRVGRYSYCDDCRGKREAEQRRTGVPASLAARRRGGAETFAQRLGSLRALAKSVDAARAKATRLTEQALAAKNEADRIEREFRDAMRDLGGAE